MEENSLFSRQKGKMIPDNFLTIFLHAVISVIGQRIEDYKLSLCSCTKCPYLVQSTPKDLQKKDITPRWIREQEWTSRMQKADKSVDRYIADIKTKCSRLGKSPEEVMSHRVRGLEPDIKSFVLSADSVDIEEAGANAMIGEAITTPNEECVSKPEGKTESKISETTTLLQEQQNEL